MRMPQYKENSHDRTLVFPSRCLIPTYLICDIYIFVCFLKFHCPSVNGGHSKNLLAGGGV